MSFPMMDEKENWSRSKVNAILVKIGQISRFKFNRNFVFLSYKIPEPLNWLMKSLNHLSSNRQFS